MKKVIVLIGLAVFNFLLVTNAMAVPVELLSQEYSIGGRISGLFDPGDTDDPDAQPTSIDIGYQEDSTTQPLNTEISYAATHGNDPYSRSSLDYFSLDVETGGHDDFGNTYGEAVAEATWTFKALTDFNQIDLEYYLDFWSSTQIRLTDVSLGTIIYVADIGLGEGFGTETLSILYDFISGNDYELYLYGYANQYDDGPNSATISISNLEVSVIPEPELGWLLFLLLIGCSLFKKRTARHQNSNMERKEPCCH